MARKEMTEEQKATARDNLARARAARREKLEARSAELVEEEPEAHVIAPQEDVEWVPWVPVEEPKDEARDKLLAAIDPDIAALFTPDEIAAIIGKATENALNEKKAQARKTLEARAKTQARVEQELVSQDVIRTAEEQARMDELVTWRCRLPDSGDERLLRIDGRIIRHDQVVTTSRAEFASAAEMMYRAWHTELRFKGLKPREQMRDFQSFELPVQVH